MKIGLISDVHATPAPVREASDIFHQEGVEVALCAGDVAGYGDALDETVEVLIENKFQVIQGNHDSWFLQTPVSPTNKWIHDYLSQLPSTLALSLEGKSLLMVHESPSPEDTKGIKLLDQHANVMADRKNLWENTLENFEHDVLIVGHTHQVFAERLAGTLVINPGSTKFNHACAILTLPDLEVRLFPLSNKDLSKVWNWGQMERMYEDDEEGDKQ
jgi:putative phosphoesterase